MCACVVSLSVNYGGISQLLAVTRYVFQLSATPSLCTRQGEGQVKQESIGVKWCI